MLLFLILNSALYLKENLHNYLPLQSVFQVICKRLVSRRVLLHLLYRPHRLGFSLALLLTSLYTARTKATPEIFKHRFCELYHEFKNYYRIFTDGSKEGNRVAAAVVHRDNIVFDTASICRAEL